MSSDESHVKPEILTCSAHYCLQANSKQVFNKPNQAKLMKFFYSPGCLCNVNNSVLDTQNLVTFCPNRGILVCFLSARPSINISRLVSCNLQMRSRTKNLVGRTCKWSNSCWKTRAGSPDKLTVNLAPVTSRASIFTDSGL